MRAISRSPLTLLVTFVGADHEHHAVAADDLAFLAHRLDRRSYLHGPFRRLASGASALAAARAAATGSWTHPSAPARALGRTLDGSNWAAAAAVRSPATARRRPPRWHPSRRRRGRAARHARG